MPFEPREGLIEAVRLLRQARHAIAFTGAGISVESGIPPFRGENGLWTKYDPDALDIRNYRENPSRGWNIIAEIFTRYFERIRPNPAHLCLARMEERGLLKAVITQNIDGLHHAAGSRMVHEFHGSFRRLVCEPCGTKTAMTPEILARLPPRCPRCLSILKPDFVFFGETIPQDVMTAALAEIDKTDLVFCIGTAAVVQPAASLPVLARRNGAAIIEVNVEPTGLTDSVTTLFLRGQAGSVMDGIRELLDA